jgi:ATP-dependent DNA ligase
VLEIPLSLEPMEAEAVDELPPAGPEWQYEPKVDGFRCLIFRDGDDVHLQSRNQKALGRFFPEIERAVRLLPRKVFILDGELVIPGQPFDALQACLHPAAARIQKLSRDTPARFVAFDLLADSTGRPLLQNAFRSRRSALKKFFAKIQLDQSFQLSRAATSPDEARKWLKDSGHGLDGIVAKRLDIPCQPGQRAMQKFKVWKTVDCVVVGVYRHQNTPTVKYLLMGLYDKEGRLNYIGRCGARGIREEDLAAKLVPLLGRGGSMANNPPGRAGGPGASGSPSLLILSLSWK